MKINQNKLFFLFSAIVVLLGIGYTIYFLIGKIDSSKNVYIEKSKEIVLIGKKQGQIEELKDELKKTAQNREEITASLLSRGDVLDFIVKIENTAKFAGLSYEVRITREITQSAIDEELLTLRRSRRRGRGQDSEETPEEQKLPGVVFNITLSGSYSGVIRFLEGVASLPYYTHVESFTISKDIKTGEEESSQVESSIQMTVFTKL